MNHNKEVAYSSGEKPGILGGDSILRDNFPRTAWKMMHEYLRVMKEVVRDVFSVFGDQRSFVRQ